MSEELMFHIKLSKKDGAKYAILPGDPGRVKAIAAFLDHPEKIGQNREYTSYSGYIDGEKVLVVSTGIGGPSAAICIEELAQIGVETLVRIGTCGGLDLQVNPGDVVIASGAIRMDGTTKEYMPVEFPAVADFEVTSAIVKASEKLGCPYHVGVVQCKDSFYGQHDPDSMGCSYELKNKWEAWKKGGCLASEMESSTLFIVSAVRRLKAGALFHCIWNQEQAGSGMPQKRTEDTTKTVQVAVEAIRTLINK
ncbi:MAG: uridine phosphorylase [Clostridiales bacterium]|nr:uridine phosphorylase [Clostridiales bacterium]